MKNPLEPELKALSRLSLLTATALLISGWTPLPIKDDRLVFIPGSQPGDAYLESATRCDNCHGGYDEAVEPAHNWRGSMMAGAARDPLWIACLVATLQDSIYAVGNPNAGDICVRCHTAGGWLGGRSDPPNLTLLTGSDFEGVNCDTCHKLVDPIAGLRQSRDLAPETQAPAILEADKTFQQDLQVLGSLTLFSGTAFLDTSTTLPTFFGDGLLPNYVEGSAGAFFVDSARPKRGPRYDAGKGQHPWYYSRFHKTEYACDTCHDVSNPVLGRLLSGDAALPEKQAAAAYVHVERTSSEFKLSAYGQPGGAVANPGINLPAGTMISKCQDCHMRDVTGKAAVQPSAPRRTDLALHDLTGGNAWLSGILASADPGTPEYFDPYNFAVLSGAKYPAAKIDLAGIQNSGRALKDGQLRALEQLRMAAELINVAENEAGVTLRIVNNTGHKLISGFPEGRRMWLNVRFYNGENSLVGEINPYEPLVVTTDADGNDHYISGGGLSSTRDDLVYEAGLSSDITGESYTFHFALGTHVHKDNRIPPKGFQISGAPGRLVVPRIVANDSPDYFTDSEYAGGYDEVSLEKPTGTSYWEAALYYQTTSKKYIEFLRNEINGTAQTLPATAYIIQSDPYFSSLKDWGEAIYDLWLHNDGCEPVLMTKLSSKLRGNGRSR